MRYYTLVGGAIILLLTSGCINYEQETFLNQDLSGRIDIHIFVDPELLIKSQLPSLISEDKGSATSSSSTILSDVLSKAKYNFNINIEEESFFKELNLDAVKDKNFKKVKRDNITHFFWTIVFDDITKLYADKERINISENEEGFIVYKEHFKISEDETETGKYESEIFEKCHFKYVLYVRGEIIEANTDDIHKNKAAWNMPLDSFLKKRDFTIAATIKKRE